MFKLPFFLFSSLLASSSALAFSPDQCTPQPSCQSMGYSKSAKTGCSQIIKCPFDLSYTLCLDCPKTETPEPAATCEQGGYLTAADSSKVCTAVKYAEKDCFNCICPTKSNSCKIGDIYYSDKKCSSEYAPCMGTPVGVVYMLTADKTSNTPINAQTSEHGRIISLHNLKVTIGFMAGDDHIDVKSTWGFYMDQITPTSALMAKRWQDERKTSAYYSFKLSEAFNGKQMTDTLKDKESQRNYCCLTKGGNEYPYTPIAAGVRCSDPNDGEKCTNKCSESSRPYQSFTLDQTLNMGNIKYAEQCISQPIQKSAEYIANGYGKGEWYLPAIGEMAYLIGISPTETIRETSIGTTSPYQSAGEGFAQIPGSYENGPINKVNQTLTKLNAAGLTVNDQAVRGMSGIYWSSTPAASSHKQAALGDPMTLDILTFVINTAKNNPYLGVSARNEYQSFRAGLAF